MVLLKRIMWPRLGEEVTIYRDGEVFVEGHVIYSGTDLITVLRRDAVTVSINCQELARGIDARKMSVQKKQR